MRLRLPAWTADRVLHILLALALVRGLIYVSIVPPWQHYDEPGHFEYAEYIARHRRLPTFYTLDITLRSEIVASMQRHRFAAYQPAWNPPTDDTSLMSWGAVPFPQLSHPPLYYLLGATVLSAFRSQPLEAHLYALRLMAVLLNLLLLLIAAATVGCLVPERKEILYGVLLFIIFLPAYSDLATAVNNDILANLIVAGLLYLLVCQVIRGPSWPLGLAIICVFIMGLVTKRTTAVGLFPILAAALISVGQRGRKYLWIAIAVLALLGLLGGIAIFGWQVGQGLGISSYIERYLFHDFFASFLDSLLDWDRSWPVYQSTISTLFRGFWGHFGWGGEVFINVVYSFLLIVTLLAVIGVIRLLSPTQSKSLHLDHRQRQALWVMIFTLAMVWLAALMRVHPIQAPGSTYVPRARYTYVAIIPVAILFVVGLRVWVPSRWRDWLVVGLAVGGILLDTLFLAKYLLPFYIG